MPGRYRVDWGHLAFVAVIAAAVVWYLCDAMSVSMSVNNLLFIVPVGVFAVLCAAPLCRSASIASARSRRSSDGPRTSRHAGADGEQPRGGAADRLAGGIAGWARVPARRHRLRHIAVAVRDRGHAALRRTAPADAGAVSTGIAVLVVVGFRAMLPYPMYTARAVGAPSVLDLNALASAAHILGSSAACWVWILPGLVIGLAGSAMPGVAISVTMAVVLPLTLQMDLMPSLVFLTSVYTGGVFGGSVPAILMNIPGTPASYATTFDGYPMTLKGQHNEALGYALFSSTLCCIVGYLLLLLMVEPMAHLVIKVGPLEMLVVALGGWALLGTGGANMSRADSWQRHWAS